MKCENKLKYEKKLQKRKEKIVVQWYNTRVNKWYFHKDDLMWLSPKWDDPNCINDALQNEVYKLEDLCGKLISRTFYVIPLKWTTCDTFEDMCTLFS